MTYLLTASWTNKTGLHQGAPCQGSMTLPSANLPGQLSLSFNMDPIPSRPFAVLHSHHWVVVIVERRTVDALNGITNEFQDHAAVVVNHLGCGVMRVVPPYGGSCRSATTHNPLNSFCSLLWGRHQPKFARSKKAPKCSQRRQRNGAPKEDPSKRHDML